MVAVSGDYSTASIDKASKATITMNEVGKEADATVTYNSKASGAQDVTATQKITCVDATATTGTKLFTSESGDKVNKNSSCAKFYLGLSKETIEVVEGSSDENVYFCAKDAKGNVISYDSYEVESSNDDVATASTTKADGKYAKITVVGNTVGSAQVNVKATKNGKDTYYTIPVSIVKTFEAATMEVTIDRSTMSNVNDDDYFATITAKLKDQNKKDVTASYEFKIIPTVVSDAGIKLYNAEDGSDTGAGVEGNAYVNTSGKVWVGADGADAKTYTIDVKGSDTNTGKTFEKKISVAVKDIEKIVEKAGTTGLNLTYQIELTNGAKEFSNKIDVNPMEYKDDLVKARLYATYNGLFAGYVRKNGATIEIAKDGYVKAKNKPTDIQVVAKFGTEKYAAGNLYGTQGDFASITSDGISTFTAVAQNGTVVYNLRDKSKSVNVAKVGTYTIEYHIYDQTDPNKYTTKTNTVTVSNSVYVPTVAVTSRTVDSINDDGIRKVLKASVDMNNNTSDYESIVAIVTGDFAGEVTPTKGTLKDVQVIDNYTKGNTSNDWTFVIPVNSTFKTE